MVNWKKYKIESKKIVSENSSYSFIHFILDGDRPCECSGGLEQFNFIFFYNSWPFNTYEVGDYIEIDTDKTKCERRGYVFGDDSMVRKPELSSFAGMVIGSTTITREQGLAIARELDSYVEQSGGKNEYTASIEVQDERGRPIKFSLSSKRSSYQ